MEIPLHAQIECTDGVCGHATYVLINPVVEKVTHLVVREAILPQIEFIVPIDLISATINNTIQLRCSKAALEKMEPFFQTRFIDEKMPEYLEYSGYSGYGNGAFFFWPYVSPELTISEPTDFQQIPAGEIAVHRGTRIEAIDGFVGHVDEFVINSENSHITHLVMREGHLWGQKDVILPVSAMGELRNDTLVLKLNKHQIESLPTFPLHRGY